MILNSWRKRYIVHDYCRYLVLFSTSQQEYVFNTYILFELKFKENTEKMNAKNTETEKIKMKYTERINMKYTEKVKMKNTEKLKIKSSGKLATWEKQRKKLPNW